MATLDDLYKQVTATNTAPKNLDELYSQTTKPKSLDELYGQATGQIQQPPNNQEKSFYEIAADVGEALMQPAATALEAISYLDKPRGAIAGTVKAAQDNTDLWEGAKKGWRENTSWKETFPEQFVKDDPYYLATIGGLAADIVADPLLIATPAKIAKFTKLDKAADAVKTAANNTELGAKVVAGLEDIAGVNRVADLQQGFDVNMAKARVLADDVADPFAGLKKQFGKQADEGTKYIEALEREAPTGNASFDVINATKDGSIYKAIKEGQITREEAYNVLRDAGEEIPDQLLQTHQRQARLSQTKKIEELQQQRAAAYDEMRDEAKENIISLSEQLKEVRKSGTYAQVIKTKEELASAKDYWNELKKYKKEIPTDERFSKLTAIDEAVINEGKVLQSNSYLPDYIYRDQVLASIPNENLRNAIQKLGDEAIKLNKQYSDEMYKLGRIGDAEYVEFAGGSHLRRSFEKYANPEDFLADVKKHGTNEEWQRAYADYAKKKADKIGGTHRVNVKDFAQRQTLSEETLQKMKVITDTEYRLKDTLVRAGKTVSEEDFLSKVNQSFGKSEKEAAMLSKNLPASRQYVPIPDTSGYGALAGKWVPKDVASQVMGTLGTKPDNINKTWQKLVSWFKVSKLAAPAPIMRNLYSGFPMANVFGKVPVQAIPADMARVIQAYKSGGKNSPLIRELRMSGALEEGFVQNELKTILTGKETGIKGIFEKGMEAFGTPDKFWRAVVFSYHRRQGKSVEEAGKIAKQALLDYSSAPDWINTLSRSGVMPFAKFPFLAGKQTAKALYNNPAQVTKYTKLQNQQNTEDREKIMPDYLKSRTLLPVGNSERIVNGKPQKVQQNIDLSYVLPFASDFKFGNPVTEGMIMAATGKNGLGMQVIKPGMTDKEKIQAWATFGLNAVAPAAVSPYNIEKIYNAAQGNVDSKGRQYNMSDALLQTIGGIKNVPLNMDEMFRQGMSKIKAEQQNAKIMMSTIAKDQSLTNEQKREKIKEHQSQIQELTRQAQEMQKAYAREKKRGAI